MMLFTFHQSLRDLYDSVIEFYVNNSMRLRCDALIGHFRLDVGCIYDQPSECYVAGAENHFEHISSDLREVSIHCVT